MLFSSPEFLFAFLPAFLLLYALAPKRARNGVVFAASVAFYFTTSGILTLILVASVVLNHLLAHAMTRATESVRTKIFIGGIVLNLLPLLIYKYAGFFALAINDLLGALHIPIAAPVPTPLLPIGISFFTFQALSYIADIYERRIAPARSLIDFGMYHSCFPQLIAGPIVRYEEIETEVKDRELSLDNFYAGSIRFCVGFAKKVILADPMGQVADKVFGAGGDVTSATAWLGLVAYTLQIYFDFAGYSDMAIGLGRMMGFPYPENFDQPYRSCSITEFWRRWHMTLSRWFRDYVYIPLGGNRRGDGRTYLNLVIVFFLCGLWHGAAYTFILWGLYHGALLVFERLAARRTEVRLPKLLAWIYALLAVMIGWVLFREPTMGGALTYFGILFGTEPGAAGPMSWQTACPTDKIVIMGIATAVALAPAERWASLKELAFFQPLRAMSVLAIFVLGTVMMAVNGFSPFIYFRF